MPWLWSLLGLPFVAALAKGIFDTATGRTAERRNLRREGSGVVIPVKELINGLGPENLMPGTNEQVAAYLQGCRAKWWNELRAPLLVYANHQPSERVRVLCDELVTVTQNAWGATHYHFLMRPTATNMDDYEAAVRAKADALTKADELLVEIRRSWPRWLRLPKRGR